MSYKIIFSEFRDFYEKIGDTYRAQAYDRAIKDPNLAGKSLKSKIDTINNGEKLQELDEIRKYTALVSLRGFGVAFVKKAMKSGIPPKSLWTDAQRLSYKYRSVICSQIPRKIIKDYIVHFRKFAPVRGLGSYRRQKAYSGDVDLMFKSADDFVFPRKIPGILGFYLRGPNKFSWLTEFDGYVFQVDLLIVPSVEYATSLLYFTGSKTFNIDMRRHAKYSGFLLNEHGLYRDGERIKTATEREIFDIIGYPYTTPKNRNI